MKLTADVYREVRGKLIELQRSIYGDERQQSLDILNSIFEEVER